ncbi:MAG: OadG family protein [Clostridia bacterium]|nr:OadG family protein [Clostridia bacterium]
MTHQVLSAAMNFGERAAYAGKMFVIGFGTIFLSLAILWGVLEIFRRLITKEKAAPEKPAAKAPVAPAPPAAAPTAPAAAPAPAAGNDALIAVITAAVAAAMAEENGGVSPNFRVVSFRKL